MENYVNQQTENMSDKEIDQQEGMDTAELQGEELHRDKEEENLSRKDKKRLKGNAELDKLKEEHAALNDKFLRLYSDFENYRKRTSRERLELLKTASEEVILALLPVLDDFDRAMRTLENAAEGDPVAEGVRLIYAKLNRILAQKGLQPTEAMGKPFDTDFHEAITHVPAPTEDLKGKVVDVTEKGYMLNDKVIRYAKVVVGS